MGWTIKTWCLQKIKNMKNLYIQCIVFLAVLSIFSCKEDKEENEKTPGPANTSVIKKAGDANLNISFLLDLSDRIDPKKYPNKSMEFYERDVAYIKSVSEAFDTHMRNKKVRQMNDQIQVFFDPEPQNNNVNAISKNLKFLINRQNASLELLDEIKNTYASKPLEIYELAINDNNFIGSDTWRFFKDKVKDYSIEEDHRNILVIFTDGYIYHENTKMKEGNKTSYITPQVIRNYGLNTKAWQEKMEKNEYGYIPATTNLQNLEVLVLGINPDPKNPYEKEVIMKYWTDWFEAMEVGRYEIKTADLPSDLDKIIKTFILK